MASRRIWAATAIGFLVLIASPATQAEPQPPRHLRGLINDYSPVSISPTGPWEIRGEWELDLKGASEKAVFTAELTMVRSDYWVWSTSANADDPAARTPHTHHIAVRGTVTMLANGFRVSGPAQVTASGNPAPFGPATQLQIDVTGGSSVPYSNIKLTFIGDAAGHFGMQPLEGVVRSWK